MKFIMENEKHTLTFRPTLFGIPMNARIIMNKDAIIGNGAVLTDGDGKTYHLYKGPICPRKVRKSKIVVKQ